MAEEITDARLREIADPHYEWAMEIPEEMRQIAAELLALRHPDPYPRETRED